MNHSHLPIQWHKPSVVSAYAVLALSAIIIIPGCDSTGGPNAAEGQGLSINSSRSAGATDEIDMFMNLLSGSPTKISQSMDEINQRWKPSYLAMLWESATIARSRELLDLAVWVSQNHSDEDFGDDVRAWIRWGWELDYQPHPRYAEFKARAYEKIDRRFGAYFKKTDNALIRLDEVVWGGVARDGIPPLKDPKMLPVDQAKYLGDSNVVFGIVIGGQAKCYPKRILAWHEMFKDTIGGQSVCGVY